MNLSATCRLFGVSRQAVYQKENRYFKRREDLEKVKSLVLNTRKELPRLGTRKLYYLLSDKFDAIGVKIGRDGLNRYLREENLLIKPNKSYTKTTHSKHWLRKHPNLYNQYVLTS